MLRGILGCSSLFDATENGKQQGCEQIHTRPGMDLLRLVHRGKMFA